MQTKRYRTDLRCAACVSTIKPLFDAEPGVAEWRADVAGPAKTLTVRGDAPPERVAALLEKAGYHSLGVEEEAPAPSEEKPASYYPLALVLLFVLGAALVPQARAGHWDGMRAMGDFMGAFFVAFAFFKLLDLRGFASSYAGYDLVARRVPAWGYAYPFVELGLGTAYLLAWQPFAVNLATLAVMLAGSAGVLSALLDKRKIRCACLGSVFNLPMSSVTLAEDLSMAAMAGFMLLWA